MNMKVYTKVSKLRRKLGNGKARVVKMKEEKKEWEV